MNDPWAQFQFQIEQLKDTIARKQAQIESLESIRAEQDLTILQLRAEIAQLRTGRIMAILRGENDG